MSSVFKKLESATVTPTLTRPREIFSALPQKAASYQYPRDVQTEVWSEWYERRQERDTVIKMNTGSGKTVVGLVILQSCLNDGKGPAVYITPDIYLTNQVVAEAENLGIEVTTNADSPRFLKQKSILVTNIRKLVNGRSVFGVGHEGIRKAIGSLLLDDAHACLATTDDQFTTKLASSAAAYEKLLTLFREDLENQSRTGILDIEAGDPSKNLLVPFWAWQQKQAEVSIVLHSVKDTDEMRFVWPLIADILPFCSCVIGGSGLEISTRCVPIDAIPSFAEAERRIFMSATLADDTVLLTTFDVSAAAAEHPITPTTAGDVGDRLILIPQELNPELSDDDVKSFVAGLAMYHNVVVIVPSGNRADYWNEVANATLDAKTLQDGVADLKRRHVGLVVIVNKYDGIDLPGDSCRVLVLDGLPNVTGRLDRIDEAVLHGTEQQLAGTIQRIEQGMGRGVRSTDDYCAVVLMGRSLTNALYIQRSIEKLTPGTRAQYQLSLQLADELRGSGIGALAQVVEDFLGRDPDWTKASKAALAQVKYDTNGNVNAIGRCQREVLRALQVRDFATADAALQTTVDQTSDKRTKGWLKQQLAQVRNRIDPVRAQMMLKSAVDDNRLVLRPIDGLAYERISEDRQSQANKAAEYIAAQKLSANHFLVWVNGILDNLRWVPGTAPKFELAVAHLGRLLGFATQRPEAEFGSGPDVLWALGGLQFLVIECKNGVTNGRVSKSDCNQLSGSLNWFKEKYDESCRATGVMIHPQPLLTSDATAPSAAVAVDIDKLNDMKAAVTALAHAMIKAYPPSDTDMLNYFRFHHLTPSTILQNYTVSFKRAK